MVILLIMCNNVVVLTVIVLIELNMVVFDRNLVSYI